MKGLLTLHNLIIVTNVEVGLSRSKVVLNGAIFSFI